MKIIDENDFVLLYHAYYYQANGINVIGSYYMAIALIVNDGVGNFNMYIKVLLGQGTLPDFSYLPPV
jgi:hypothetical protein